MEKTRSCGRKENCKMYKQGGRSVCGQLLSKQRIRSQEQTEKNAEPKTLLFRDVYGVEYETEIDPEAAKNPYDKDLFQA